MILQRVLFPSENRPKELYMRDKGEWVSFDTFFNSYPKVREFLDETIKNCEKNLYVETIF